MQDAEYRHSVVSMLIDHYERRDHGDPYRNTQPRPRRSDIREIRQTPVDGPEGGIVALRRSEAGIGREVIQNIATIGVRSRGDDDSRHQRLSVFNSSSIRASCSTNGNTSPRATA